MIFPLFPGAAQHKVDGDNLNHLDKSMVFGIDNAVLHFLNGQIVRHWIEAGGLLLLDTGRAFGQAFLFKALFAFFFALLALAGRSFLAFFLGRSFSRISYPRTSSNSAGKSASPDRRRFGALGFLSFGGFCLRCLPADLEGSRFFTGLFTVTADNAAIPQVFQKSDQKLR